MSKIKEIKADEIWKLLDELEQRSQSHSDPKHIAVLMMLGLFFGTLTLEQKVLLENICLERDTEKYSAFVETYPDITVSTEGIKPTTQPKVTEATYEIIELAINKTFNGAKENLSKGINKKEYRQIINAGELSNIKNSNLLQYGYIRKKYVTIYPEKYPLLKRYEKDLKDKFDIRSFLSLILDYVMKHPGSETFLTNVFARLDSLSLDKNNESELNKKYIELIKEILETK